MLPTRGPKNLATFSLESSLPKFPLPSLKESLNKFENFAKVFCNGQEEIDELNSLIKRSEIELKKYQTLLEERYEKTDNYVHGDWWSQYAYCEDRSPITPIESTPLDFAAEIPLKFDRQLVAAILIRNVGQIHMELEKEQYPISGFSSKEPISMIQYRSIYECCRIPKRGCDEQKRYFVTQSENTRVEPRYFILGCHGRLYSILIDSPITLEPLSVRSIYKSIQNATNHAIETKKTNNELTDVGFLTGSYRDLWAEARELLTLTDERNCYVLNKIERSILFVTFADYSPMTSEVLLTELSMSTDGGSRWYDKSSQLVIFQNSKIGYSMEHSVMDAAQQLSTHEKNDLLFREFILRLRNSGLTIDKFLEKEENLNGTSSSSHKEDLFEFLYWGIVPSKVHSILFEAKNEYLIRRNTVWNLKMERIRLVSRNSLKKYSISPDSFVQMAFQAAFKKQFGFVPNTYESVGVLRFRYGRTETGRCASLTSKKLLDSLIVNEKSMTIKEMKQIGMLLKEACKDHESYIRDCSFGKGFDRHFFALRCLVKERNLPLPEIFQDKIFQRLSNWDLSTSNCFVGGKLQSLSGGTSFRPVSNESIGVVYGIFPDWVDVTIMSVVNKTDLFYENLLEQIKFFIQCLDTIVVPSTNNNSKV